MLWICRIPFGISMGYPSRSGDSLDKWDIPLNKKQKGPMGYPSGRYAREPVGKKSAGLNVFETLSPPYRFIIDYPTFPYEKRSKSTDKCDESSSRFAVNPSQG